MLGILGILPDVPGFYWNVGNTTGETVGDISQTIGDVIGNTMTDFYRLFGLSWEMYTTFHAAVRLTTCFFFR